MNDQISSLETQKLLALAQLCLGNAGDFVELGCFRGDTSVLLGKVVENSHKPVQNTSNTCAKDGQKHPGHCGKRLFIYDSFAGLPEKSPQDSSGAGKNFQKGELFVTKKDVILNLKKHGLNHVLVKKAWFSELKDGDLPEQIAFAFIDGDFYQSQKDGLKLVSPRLSKGGIIICHDYNNPELPGASRAVDEFLSAHKEYQLRVYKTLAILKRP